MKPTGLKDMTGIAFLRAGSNLLMTANTLLVKRVRAFGHTGIFTYRLVTIDTGRHLCFAFFQVMVTITTGESVAGVRGMGLVIKQDITGHTMKHDSYRAFRRFCRKRSITDGTHYEQNDSQSISHLQLFF